MAIGRVMVGCESGAWLAVLMAAAHVGGQVVTLHRLDSRAFSASMPLHLPATELWGLLLPVSIVGCT